ncbi:MAG TPA: alkanal monooxygenase, partial [Diaminobutyricibacter sp.]
AHEFTALEKEFIEARVARQAVGTPDEVEARLTSLLQSTRADELMIASGAATVDARIRSLQIVADRLGARATA